MKTLLSLVLPAKLDNLDEAMKSVSGCAMAQGFDSKRSNEIKLAVEEAFVNICHYSYPTKTGEVGIICRIEDNHFIIEISDSGIPFDITKRADPDINAATETREIGGLGIFLIKKLMDRVTYRREAGKNILALVVRKE